ncbi:Spy/CpxP family protein refolding chaperone [Bradyrhizobium sp.]|uniref:Spy/CpxP family protein refolding chaperone n=1 Tax=Bradyrhizobium sp. TaxID=376 RepID=UPI002D5447B9|nr:Spy/CpxP family protein refolding chaperone [Bradyrhizobium sp.]HZR74452.1 Spy/CpxP family protein refolding chaperone [Bradyrhizobium sp.]
MIKKAAVAAIALLMTTSSLAYAAETSSTVGMRGPSPADLKSLTDLRVNLVKSALQLTPDQEKYWAPLEEAIRARAKNRAARMEHIAELRDNGPLESLGDRNPVEMMQRRADRLIQRGNDLKKVADAWEPLFKTLSQDQKKRMAFVTMVGARAMRDAIIEHRNGSDSDEDSDE